MENNADLSFFSSNLNQFYRENDMEDASNEKSTLITMPVPTEDTEVLAADDPQTEHDPQTVSDQNVKVNGDKIEDSDGLDSSDCDTLIIDEKPLNNRNKRKLLPLSPKGGFKGFKRVKGEHAYEPPTNPYFNESLFELSELHHKENTHSTEDKHKNEEKNGENIGADGDKDVQGEESTNPVISTQTKKSVSKKKKSSKLREYAQYLGLQPTVQFKCSKCAQSGFPSLPVLNEHHRQCRGLGQVSSSVSTNAVATPSTNFRVTRKVFLCSACGTYYENWNLFLHMREVHKRFICLYCLGMFSLPEKLSLHLISKHNCVPNQLNTEQDFFEMYKEPCFLICCECEKIFEENENFFDHHCLGKPNKNVAENKNTTSNKPSANAKQTGHKNTKQAKNKTFIEHVTGDTTVNENETINDNLSGRDASDILSVIEEIFKSSEENNTDKLVQNKEINSVSLNYDQIKNIENSEVHSDNSIIATETERKLKSVESNLSDNGNNLKFDENSDEHENYPADSKELGSEDDSEKNSSLSSSTKSPELANDDTTNIQINDDNLDDDDEIISNTFEQEDTRKVPKVTLKLPKSLAAAYIENEDSDDSDKLTMELKEDVNFNDVLDEERETKEDLHPHEPQITVAGPEVPIIELELEQPLDKFDIQILLQKCLKLTVPTCVYCNHARKIAVNGKQLGLHAIAEHRFSAVVNSITAEELIPESFVIRIKENLSELQQIYFNLDSTANDEGVTFSHVFECFQCRYATTVHKELYLHNRKMHAKTILLCIMCKSNFYSYSELICHLCPGVYELTNDVNFRCCMCVNDDLPSAFRLMVHLRKRHHACDVCLELCNNQSRLSNHVWKHKLHHLCYRCGIAYRNKPDITKHLFWKHGTESVLCKRCLQKKWPHVYHFCIPPSTFTCEECGLNFTKAVALKVHKRLHSNDKPHCCTFENCTEKFVSRKLLLKHEFKHREPPEEALEKDKVDPNENIETTNLLSSGCDAEEKLENENSKEEIATEEKPKTKPQVDVYDLPELNLSESDSSDSEDETQKVQQKEETQAQNDENLPNLNPVLDSNIEKENANINPEDNVNATTETLNNEQPTTVLENIWDNFKNYQASKEKFENVGSTPTSSSPTDNTESEKIQPIATEDQKDAVDVIMRDHDYSLLSQEYKTDPQPEAVERTQSIDHDYCSSNAQTDQETQKQQETVEDTKAESSQVLNDKKDVKGTSSSNSSDDSDSSSCTCGSNCSCSSSSNSSSSSSDSSNSDSSSSEGRRKQQLRRERRKQRAKNKTKENENSPIDVVATTDVHPPVQLEQLIQESDLDTTETETDEDFYDEQPQKLVNKLLAEKRKELLLAEAGPLVNGSVLESSRPSTPSLPETEIKTTKKKSKNKKKKKKNKKQDEKPMPSINIPSTSYQYQYQSSTVSPLTISLPKNSPLNTPTLIGTTPPLINNPSGLLTNESTINSSTESGNTADLSLRASKRRRIPNKFYGYSSDDEREKHQPPILKWRKADLPSPIRQPIHSPLVVPSITIKAIPPPVTEAESTISPNLSSVSEMRMQPPGPMQSNYQSLQPVVIPHTQEQDSGTESNESTSEEEEQPPPLFVNKPNQPPLYCYCRCPYDEVSEMIGCDSNDCLIEWFHFECVGIMVPPKGQWFCPDCRKKKQQRKELLQA